MKLKIFLLFFLTVSHVGAKQHANEALSLSPVNGGNIQAGAGYSSDAQQTALQPCFNATISSQSNPESFLQLSSAISFKDLEETLKINVSIGTNLDFFSGDAEANYFRSIKDKEYSLSLNYYQYAASTAQVALNGFGLDALNAAGKAMYAEGKNPYFGIVCGDNYIANFKQGAMLVMSLNLNFANHWQKEAFQAHAGASFGSIFQAAADIQWIANQYNINGQATIQAYQRGGEPSQLAKILSKDAGGQYYALSCDLKHMDNCIKAASGLLDYARNDFSTQFNFSEQRGLTPLGNGFSEYILIKYIGLKAPDSLVTPEVAQARANLATEINKYNYYRQKLAELITGYPVGWNTASNVYNNIQRLLQQAEHNIATILNSADPEHGARVCFDMPDQCVSVAQQIMTNIKPITATDLQQLDPIKYIMPAGGGVFYRNGDDNNSWIVIPVPDSSNSYIVNVRYVSISDSAYIYDVDVHTPDLFYFHFEGGRADEWSYSGSLCDARDGLKTRWEHCWQVRLYKQLSPFYFVPFQTSK